MHNLSPLSIPTTGYCYFISYPLWGIQHTHKEIYAYTSKEIVENGLQNGVYKRVYVDLGASNLEYRE